MRPSGGGGAVSTRTGRRIRRRRPGPDIMTLQKGMTALEEYIEDMRLRGPEELERGKKQGADVPPWPDHAGDAGV